jgi:hypothetical protein
LELFIGLGRTTALSPVDVQGETSGALYEMLDIAP